jgi:spore coat polysaccharide biosynthesis protein SpsF
MGKSLKTIAIVQARMGSTRFPGKVMADLCAQPMLSVLLHRLKMTSGLDEIIVATTWHKTDDVLVNWLDKHGVDYFRGSENDVLDRFHKCASYKNADLIVRVTADDPLKDHKIIERALSIYAAEKTVDYVSNTLNPTFPEGLDIEVFSFAALDRTFREATLSTDREHVTPYIWRNTSKFNIVNFTMESNLSMWRWTVDKPKDLEFVTAVFSHFGNNIGISYIDIINLIYSKPELLQINAGTLRNEGYLISLSKERQNE